MKKTIIAFVFLIFINQEKLHPEIYTNTILPFPIDAVSSHVTNIPAIISNNLSETNEGVSRILITRIIETRNKINYFYFINIDTLRFGLSDAKPAISYGKLPVDSEYCRILQRQNESKIPYGNFYELTLLSNGGNIVLTTDLCPARTNYDSLFYNSLESLKKKTGTNISLVVFFSGKWIKSHRDELIEIKNSGLDFIAGNHTYNHRIIESGKENSDLDSEIISTEIIMLNNGILPSYFFRFPGLKFSSGDFKTLNSLNCISINANEWMGTKAKNWGILLVHSNGVASSEVRIFSKYLSKNESQFCSGSLVFRDIFSYLDQNSTISPDLK